MRSIIKFSVIVLLIGLLFHISCQKELSCYDCKNNKPPIANAGKDTAIILPVDSINLNGSISTDPDGTIASYTWTKISGPVSSDIIKPDSSKPLVKTLVMGVYKFELTVTDNGGLSAKDTVQITVNEGPQSNQPPIANAGTDQSITLPVDTATLDGSASTDPDNNITGYSWTKISGPSSSIVTNANSAQTLITNLVQGIYQFELKVTDTGGLFSKDTIQITVNAVVITACDNSNRPQLTAQLIPMGTLSQTRDAITVASAGNKILFAGGYTSSSLSSRVDIYDIGTQVWSTDELCAGRYMMAAITAENKIFFGGGESLDGTWPLDSVDIYDVSANTWSVSHLSAPGHSMAAAAVGNKVFFAGGDQGFNGTPGINRARQVDIYDLGSNTWSSALLSEDKIAPSAVTANNKIYFAGGETIGNQNCNIGSWYASNKIDIYDNATNTWSTSSMLEGKLGFASVEVAGKIYWAGGHTGDACTFHESCVVEIRDVTTGNSTIEYLFRPAGSWLNEGPKAVVKENKIIFHNPYGSYTNMFDIYDIATNTWSIGVLPINIEGASIISVNNIIYVAGGTVNGVLSNQVWKLEF